MTINKSIVSISHRERKRLEYLRMNSDCVMKWFKILFHHAKLKINKSLQAYNY
jgi:hypothetical protein